MATILAFMWAWGRYDSYKEEIRMKQAGPISLPRQPRYQTEDVSILVPTINTPSEFTDCLRLWVANKPKEVVIVTIPRDLDRVVQLAASIRAGSDIAICIHTVPRPGRRAQMRLALEQAKGHIMAFVDDDTYWPSDQVLPHLLAPFQDPSVGGVVGKQSAIIPAERQKSNIITPWEVAAVRSLDAMNIRQFSLHATDGTVWCMTGRTMLGLAAALKDKDFLFDLTHETFAGKPINTGDDSFLTRWLHTRGWNLRFQNAPEAEVLTLVERDNTFAKQLTRWSRSGFQGYIRRLTSEPGFCTIYKKHPYFGRKLLETLGRPFLTALHLWGWIKCIREQPMVALGFASWYFLVKCKSYRAFMKQHPYVGLRNIWAAVAIDHAYLILDPYTSMILNTEGWISRNDSPTSDPEHSNKT